MFRVVPDQLRISEGWVRCGQCEEVFDASANLLDSAQIESTGKVSSQQDESATDASTAQRDQNKGVPEVVDSLAPDAPDQPQPHDALETPPQAAHSTHRPTVLDDLRVIDDVFPPTQTLGNQGADAGDSAIQAESEAQPSTSALFMRDKSAVSMWHRPLVRAGLIVAAMLLSLGLTTQVLVHERDRVAATEPGLKPLLEGLCELAGCTVATLRQIESIVIDSSAFSKIRGDVYRLNVTIKNTAAVEVAMPALELSLTDIMDQPVMRRVFLPVDWMHNQTVLAPRSEASTSLVLAVKANGSTERIAGYRVLAFYP
jgi:predicted Zn finger-like uncharacterized protein